MSRGFSFLIPGPGSNHAFWGREKEPKMKRSIFRQFACPPPCNWAILGLAGCIIGSLAVNEPARGEYDPPMYVLFEHGDFNSSNAEVIAFGINNNLECVGMVRATSTGNSVAYVWLPFDAYSEDAGIHSIETMTSMGAPGGTSSGLNIFGTKAFDINDAGIAVGGSNDSTNGANAYYWVLSSGSDTSIGVYVNAFSINNDEDAKVVGGDGSLWEYLLTTLPTPSFGSGFIHEIGVGTTTLAGGETAPAVAHGVANTIGGSDALIAGLSISCEGIGCGELELCDDVLDGVHWTAYTEMQDGDELYPYAIVGF